jgi:hypothetical protein
VFSDGGGDRILGRLLAVDRRRGGGVSLHLGGARGSPRGLGTALRGLQIAQRHTLLVGDDPQRGGPFDGLVGVLAAEGVHQCAGAVALLVRGAHHLVEVRLRGLDPGVRLGHRGLGDLDGAGGGGRGALRRLHVDDGLVDGLTLGGHVIAQVGDLLIGLRDLLDQGGNDVAGVGGIAPGLGRGRRERCHGQRPGGDGREERPHGNGGG